MLGEMLTRYLYDCDEVCFMLIDSLHHCRSQEAVFWAEELLLSKEDELLDKTVVRAWVLFLGAPCINWLDAWFAGLDKLTLLLEFSSLIKKGRSCSPLKTFIMFGRGFSSVTDVQRMEQAVRENDPFSFYWWSGPYEKSPSALLNVVKEYVEDPVLFESLDKAFKMFPLSMKSLLGCVAVQLLCLKSYPEAYVLGASAESERSFGMKANRMYSISEKALPCRHVRKTQYDVLCRSHKEIMKDACTVFWKEIDATVIDDDSLEAAVEEYFPDDTPDEWSIEDRSCSHPVKFTKYKRFIKPSYRAKLLWGFAPVIKKEWDLDTAFKACLAPEY